MSSTKDKIRVMEAYLAGKTVRFKYVGDPSSTSVLTRAMQEKLGRADPVWNWVKYEYWVEETLPSINWDHVTPKLNFLAVDKDGSAWLFENEPEKYEDYWANRNGDAVQAKYFFTYLRGDTSWENSIVKRPKE